MAKNRYVVKPASYFIHGARAYEVIDTKNDSVCYDSIMQSNCLARARELNRQDRIATLVSGGFNGRRK